MAYYNLKACPFCGGRPYIEAHTRCFVNGESTKAAYVRCTECECRTEKFPVSLGPRKAVEAAVNRWNSRFECISYIPVNDHLH